MRYFKLQLFTRNTYHDKNDFLFLKTITIETIRMDFGRIHPRKKIVKKSIVILTNKTRKLVKGVLGHEDYKDHKEHYQNHKHLDHEPPIAGDVLEVFQQLRMGCLYIHLYV